MVSHFILHLGKPNTGPEHYKADETIVADANKYHAQVTASHARLGGASSVAAIQQLLGRMEQDLTRTMTEAMMQQLATKVDTLEAKVNRIAEQVTRVEQKVTRVEQIMSAGVSHCFPSMSVHEYQNRYTTKALTARLPATSGLWRITMERTR